MKSLELMSIDGNELYKEIFAVQYTDLHVERSWILFLGCMWNFLLNITQGQTTNSNAIIGIDVDRPKFFNYGNDLELSFSRWQTRIY
jgi:hypothetical protein